MATARSKPEPRSVAFTSDGSLLIAYLEHGISYVYVVHIFVLCLIYTKMLGTGRQDAEVEFPSSRLPHVC